MAVRKTMDEIMRDREAAKRRREQEESERANKLRTDPEGRNGFQANGLPGWTTPPETLQPEQMLRQKENRVPEEQIQKYYDINIIQPSMSWEDYKKKLEEEKVTYTGVEGMTNDSYKSYLESIKDKTDAMNANSIKATEDEVKAQKNLVKALERMKNSRTMESTTEDGSKLYNGYSYEDEVKKLQQMENAEDSRKQNEWLDKQQKNLDVMQDENVREYVKTIAEYEERQKNNYSGVVIPKELEAYSKSLDELERLGYSTKDIRSLKDTYNRESNAKAKAELHEEVENSVNKNAGSQVLHSVGSVGANLLSGIGLVESAGAALQEAVSGEYVPVDTNSPYYYPGDYRDTVRENVAQNITNAVENPVAKKVLPMVYQAGMSTADTLTASALGGEGFTLATMGAGAASGSAKDTFERTGDTGKALATGVAAGAIEVMTEKVSLDNLWDIVKKTGKAATRSTLVNLLVQSGVEGSEETVSEIANHIVDQMINGGMSEYNQNVQNYISQGMSEEEARAQANRDFGNQVLESFTVGAMAGAMGGGIGTVAGTVNQSMAGKELQESGDIKDIAARAYAYDDYFVQKALADYEKHPGGYQAANLYNEVARFEKNQGINTEAGENNVNGQKNEYGANTEPQTVGENVQMVNVEQSLQKLSQAQTAEELVEAVREVERAGSQEEIETARMRYEYQSEKLMSEGRISEAELQQAENSLTEQEAYELGLQNEKVEKDTLSLKGRIAYNQGVSEYNQQRVAKNTIAKKEIAKVQNADAVGSNGGKIKVFEIKSVDTDPVIVTSEGVEQLSEVSFENEAIQTLYNHASMQETVQAANTYLKNYPGGIMVQAYDMYYKRFLNAGKLGLSYENALKRNQFVTSHISEESLREIYDAGKEIYNTSSDIRAVSEVKNTTYEKSEDKNLYQYIKDALAGKLAKKSYYKLSEKINNRLAKDIERIVGFSVEGYGNEISPGNIAHINRRHGERGTADHSMKNLHDVARIQYVIDNYDKVREGEESGQYRNSDGSMAKTIELQKQIEKNYYYVVEAVPNTKKKSLQVVSAYINKNDTFPEEAVPKSPSRYVQDEAQSNVSFSDTIIADDMQNASKNQEIAPVQQRTVSRKGSGKVIDERRSNEAEPLMQLYEKLAEKTGQDIVLKDKDMEGINGEFNRSMSTIVFNMDAKNKYTTIFHEALGEFSESWAPEQMAEFQNDLLEWYFNEYSDAEMNQIIGKYQEVYAEKEGVKSYREAANELVNDALAGLFTTDTGMEDFTNWLYENKPQKEAKSVVQKIADLIKELCDKIKTYLKDGDIGTAAKKTLRMEADRAAGLRMRLLEIADEAAENYKRAGVEDNDINTSDVRHSYEMSEDNNLYDFIEDSLNGKRGSWEEYELHTHISERMANDIEKYTGVDASGFRNIVKPDDIGHVEKRHGKKGIADQSMSNHHDLAKIKYVIDNYDKMEAGGLSESKRNSDGTRAKTIVIQKKIGDRFYYVVEAVPDSKSKTLFVTSAYINRNDTFSQVANDNIPDLDVHNAAESDVSSSNNIIADDNQNATKTKHSLSEFVEEVLDNKGQTSYKFNQIRIEPVSNELATMINKATGGRVDTKQKYFALEGSKLYHEIESHSNEKKETGKGQKPYDKKDVGKIISTLLEPDIIEDISSGDKLDQRNTVAFAKEIDGEFVVVAAIGGKRNPNIVPEQVLWFTKERWEENVGAGKTIKEMLYEYNWKRELNGEELKEIKKNRVTVVHNESKDSSARTSKTPLRSPLSTSSILKNEENASETKKFSLEVPLDNYEIVDDDVQMLRSVGRKSINEFTSEDIQKSQKWAYKFYQEMGTKSPFFRTWFGDWRAYEKTKIAVTDMDANVELAAGKSINRDTERTISWSKDVTKESVLNASKDTKSDITAIAANMPQIVENAILLDTFVSTKSSKRKLEGTSWMHSFYTLVSHDGKTALIKLFAEEAFSQKQNEIFTRAYSLKYIKKVAEIDNGVLSENGGLTESHPTTSISISDLHNLVKQYDQDFQPKSVNMDLLNADGTPKVLYHGTNADFTEFDISKNKTITFGNGFYFGENKDAVSKYYAGENGKVMEAYLNMKKPFVIETSQLKDIDAVPDVVGNYFGEVNVTKGNIRDILKSHGYDGIHYKNTKTKGNDVWVAYDSGQIKSATDNIGTFDGKNPDVRYSLSGTTNLDAYWENYDGFDEVFGSSASILEEGALAMQGKEVERDTVKKLARKMKQEYRSNIDLDTFTDNLVKVFSYMQTQKKANYEDMLRVMNEIAMPVIEESMGYDATEVQQYKEMKQKLRGYKLKLTEEQKQEVGYYYGNYEVFRRSCFGTLNFTDNGTYLDNVWSELVELTGGFLEYGINDKDQAIMLKHAIDAMKPQLRNNFGADNHGVAMDLSLRIYEEYFKAQEGAKAQELRKAMVHERAEFHDKLRKQYYEKLAAEKKRMKEKTGTIAQRVAEVKAANTQSQLEKVNRQRAAQYRNEIKRTGGELIRWIETPTDKKHVPEALKKTTLEFLSAIDFISHRALDDSDSTRRWQEKMGAVARQLQMAEQSEMSDEYGNFIIDLDPDFVPMLETFLRKNDGVEKISQMEYDQLENLNTLMTTLKRTIAKANELHRNDRYKYVAEVANGTIVELQKKKSRKPHAKAVDMASNLLNFDMLDSFTYFETLGETAASIHKELREGFNIRTWHLKEAQEYMQELLKGKKIKDWTGDKAQVHEFNTRDGKLKLSTGQIMSLYLLGKRSQGMQHILSGGIRAAQNGKGKNKILQVKPQHVTKRLYQEMIGVLTEEQREVADKMQKFLAKNCAEWGNHTSMTLYNYKKFMDERYFPIKTYDNSRMTNDKNTSDTASLYAIKNQGMTKNLVPGARNALVIEDIMDVFTNHVTAMANYDAFAVPLSDAMKWFNYKNEGMVGEQLESDSVKEELERVYGKKAKDYFVQFMKDINGEAGSGSSEKISEAFISRYKAAAVGANVRVAIQQPTAYMRAALLLNPIDMMRGMAGLPNVKRAKKYSAIALWKSWGYYETSIGQSMKQVITGQSTLSDNIRDKASILAALGDEVTWGYLWNACESEVRRTKKDIKPDTEEFYRKVAERFDDVIDQTQVVDTVLHRSQFMKDKDNLRKLEAAFMSEPTKSYNMLYRGMKKGKKELAKAVLVYGMTGVLTSLAAAVMDAFRDDDREKTFREKYLESVKGNMLDNVNILGTIPYIKDVFSFVNGYEAERMDMAGIANLISSMQMIYKYVFDDSKKTTYGVVKSAARAVSQVSGIPFYNLLREVESLAENITGENWLTNKESNTELYRKLIQYGEEGNEEKYQKTMDKLLENGIEQEEINKKVISEAKKQFKEGALSRAETEDILKEYGMEADDIYWALNKAEGGDDYNKYNELYEAVESGKGLKSAIKELTGHGVEEKTIGSRITARYKEEYVKLYRTNKTQAAALKARLLNAYVQLGFDREKRSKAIDQWIE